MSKPLTGLVFAIIVLAVIVFAINLSVKNLQPSVIDNMTCKVDSDCVAAQCCHATEVINKNFAPDCKEIFCTMECRSGTIDCDHGEIKCVDSKCTVIWPEEK